MRIESNVNAGGIDGPTPPKRNPTPARPVAAAASFSAADALDTSIKSAPDSRPGAVAAAKMLIADDQYPPPGVIRGISTLLADNINSNGD